MAVVKVRQAVLVRAVTELLFGLYDHADHEARIEGDEGQDCQGVEYPECSRDAHVGLIDGLCVRRVPGRDEIRRDDQTAVQLRVYRSGVEFICHVLRVEDNGNHGKTVEVEAEAVPEEDRRDAHVKGEPAIDEPYVDIEFVFRDEVKADYIDQSSRDREPYEE